MIDRVTTDAPPFASTFHPLSVWSFLTYFVGHQVVDLTSGAFSCATRHGEFQKAVELLGQGRGTLWNQLACLSLH